MATVIEPGLDAVEHPIIEPDEEYEVVDGRIVEEPHMGAYEATMASRLLRSIVLFDPEERWGQAVMETLFVLNNLPMLRRRPDLAVEITSPTDAIDDLMDKLEEYFRAGVRLAWVVYPKHRKIYAYESTTNVRILQVGDELDGGPVLPGFRMRLAALFEVQGDGPTPAA
jgi:Uma2 family endonuclease